MGRQRNRIFFPEKIHRSLTHSFSENFVFFVFLFFRQKTVFFFPRKSLQATHSPKKMISPKKGQKRSKQAKKSYSNFGGVFFSQKNLKTFRFFFFPEKFTL